jgi:hypothetical protein
MWQSHSLSALAKGWLCAFRIRLLALEWRHQNPDPSKTLKGLPPGKATL